MRKVGLEILTLGCIEGKKDRKRLASYKSNLTGLDVMNDMMKGRWPYERGIESCGEPLSNMPLI